MEKEFPRGFQQGIADILEMCMKRKTDNCIMTLDCGDVELTMKIVFSAKKKEPEARV